MAKRFALVSVSDKTGLVGFVQTLHRAGWGIIATGGTADYLADEGIDAIRVAEVTGFPEILDGRVKTLHPTIHAALLARRDVDDHRATLDAHDIPDIRLVAVNLYPFNQTVSRPGCSADEAIEAIDIGGPTLLRAAAKNHASMTVVSDVDDYERVGAAAEAGTLGPALRAELAVKAFEHTAGYDAQIVRYLTDDEHGETSRADASRDDRAARPVDLPHEIEQTLSRTQVLRYGENPHQRAALYARRGAPEFGGVVQLHGKELSYNNLVDLDAAVELVAEFDMPAAAVIKHTNPAGCAVGQTLGEAYDAALACDPMSAYGGIVAVNRPIERRLADKLADHFFEVIAAPSYREAALTRLTDKKNLRLLRLPDDLGFPGRRVRATAFGHLVQYADPPIGADIESMSVPTARAPSAAELAGLAFVWKVCKHVKSNAIVIGRGVEPGGAATIGVGAGQMSRVDAVELSISKARQPLGGAVLASDAFFPFRDGVDAAAEAGVSAIIQPGGSKRDAQVIGACNDHEMAMVFAGARHFRH